MLGHCDEVQWFECAHVYLLCVVLRWHERVVRHIKEQPKRQGDLWLKSDRYDQPLFIIVTYSYTHIMLSVRMYRNRLDWLNSRKTHNEGYSVCAKSSNLGYFVCPNWICKAFISSLKAVMMIIQAISVDDSWWRRRITNIAYVLYLVICLQVSWRQRSK